MDQRPSYDNLCSYYHPHHHSGYPVAAFSPNELSLLLPAYVVYPRSAPSAVYLPLERETREEALASQRARGAVAGEWRKQRRQMPGDTSSERKEQQQQWQRRFEGSFVSPSPSSYMGPSREFQSSRQGKGRQGYTTHVIRVGVAEDVRREIYFFMLRIKCNICILSASGSISSVLTFLGTGVDANYQAPFEIIGLSGSYVHGESGRITGGLSVSLSDANGQIYGGVVRGPLVASGPVQVIICSFPTNSMGTSTAIKGNPSGRLPAPAGRPAAPMR